MNKDELYKLALSGPSYKTYKQSVGFDECEKFVDAFSLKLNQGKHIPVWVVYLYYYNWVKESGKKPERYTLFCWNWSKHTKSIPYSDMTQHRHFRAYKIENFPKFTINDELAARKLIRGQKERKALKKKKNKIKSEQRRRAKEILQSEG